MPKPVKLITWGTEYSEMLAEMGILEGEQSRFIRLLIDEAYRRFRAGNPVSVVDAMLSDTSVSEKAGNKRTDRQTLVLLAAAWWEHADIHSTLKCRCLPVRSNVNDRMREGAGSFGNFSKPNIAQRDSV